MSLWMSPWDGSFREAQFQTRHFNQFEYLLDLQIQEQKRDPIGNDAFMELQITGIENQLPQANFSLRFDKASSALDSL